MADIALGATCPRDGSFVAVSGSFADDQLVGQCPVCQQSVVAPNPQFSQALQDERAKQHAAEQAAADEAAPVVATPNADAPAVPDVPGLNDAEPVDA